MRGIVIIVAENVTLPPIAILLDLYLQQDDEDHIDSNPHMSTW